jgi:Ca2+-binding EF-hand superfamily protein
MMACIPQRVLLTNENLALVFKTFDADGSGYISDAEVKRVISTKSKLLSDAVAVELMKQIDQDGDGELQFEEFILLMRNG